MLVSFLENCTYRLVYSVGWTIFSCQLRFGKLVRTEAMFFTREVGFRYLSQSFVVPLTRQLSQKQNYIEGSKTDLVALRYKYCGQFFNN